MPPTPTRFVRSRVSRIVAGVAVIACYLAYGLYPFEFRSPLAPNSAARLEDGSLLFAGPGIAIAPDPPTWLAVARVSGRLEFLARVQPFRGDVRGPARVITVSRDHQFLNVTLGQEADQLTITVRTPYAFRNGEADFRIPGAFVAGRWVELRVAFEPGRLRAWVDGVWRLDEPLPPDALGRFSDKFWLAVGNEVGGGSPWFGRIAQLEVRVPGERLNYLEAPDLVVPTHVRAMHNRPRLAPGGPFTAWDAVQNVAGFIPLGALLALRLGRRGASGLLIAATCGFALSASIEVAQYWLPGRFPSIDDLWMNTLGTIVGYSIAHALVARQQQRRTPSQRSTRSRR